MSVLIKGSKMPESCGTCFVGNRTICKNGCPIVDLGKHGRLIDADAFKTDYRMSDDCDSCDTNWKSCQYDTVYAKMDFCGCLDDAPTVIEAEDE